MSMSVYTGPFSAFKCFFYVFLQEAAIIALKRNNRYVYVMDKCLVLLARKERLNISYADEL
jgi:hypothetical protein